jgi:hypothetical protein
VLPTIQDSKQRTLDANGSQIVITLDRWTAPLTRSISVKQARSKPKEGSPLAISAARMRALMRDSRFFLRSFLARLSADSLTACHEQHEELDSTPAD